MAEYSENPSKNNSNPLLDNVYRAALNSVAPTLTESVELMNTFNQNRLFWVWGSGLLSTVLDLIPHDLFDALNLNNASQMLSDLAPYTGMLSFILYYIRLLFNIALVFALSLKNTQDAYEADRNSDKVWISYFFHHLLIQLTDKKFALINDIFWAPGNMVCFLWLNTKAALGFWGDVLTVFLLTIDTINAILEYLEHSNQKESTTEWEAKQIDLIRNILYALALLIAFSLIVAGSVFPPLSTAGTFICFFLTVSHNFTNSGMGIYNAYCNKEEAQIALANPYAEDKNDLQIKATYHEELFVIKTLQLFPVVIPQLLIPPLVFAAFMITPAGAGFAAVVSLLVVTAVLATAAAYILKSYEPAKPEGPKSGGGNKNLFFSADNKENQSVIQQNPEHVSNVVVDI